MQLTFFLVLAVLTAWKEGLNTWRWPQQYLLPTMVTTLLLGIMVVATKPLKRAAVARREPRVYFAMASGRAEMVLWVALSLMAGVAEESVYRGVFSDLALRLTGSLAATWMVAVLAFSIAHANQGPQSMAVIAAFSLVAHVLVYFTGTLLFAIVLHAAYDVIAGFEYARLGRQLGYPEEVMPDAAADRVVTTSGATSSP